MEDKEIPSPLPTCNQGERIEFSGGSWSCLAIESSTCTVESGGIEIEYLYGPDYSTSNSRSTSPDITRVNWDVSEYDFIEVAGFDSHDPLEHNGDGVASTIMPVQANARGFINLGSERQNLTASFNISSDLILTYKISLGSGARFVLIFIKGIKLKEDIINCNDGVTIATEIPTCVGDGKALQYDGSNWSCVTIQVGLTVEKIGSSCRLDAGKRFSDYKLLHFRTAEFTATVPVGDFGRFVIEGLDAWRVWITKTSDTTCSGPITGIWGIK